MPYRSITVWVVVLGVLAMGVVAALAVCGVDVRRAAATGPRWKRAPLTASLLLLGLLGVGSVAGAMACCYEPMPLGAGLKYEDFMKSLERLGRQLPLLERFARAQKIEPDVVRKLLATAERDVMLLESAYAGKELLPSQHARARELCARAREPLERLRLRVGYDDKASTYFEWNEKLYRERLNADSAPPR